MKRNVYLLLLFLVGGFTACNSNEEQVVTQSDNEEFVRTLSEIGTRSFSEEILSFASNEEMEETISVLLNMTDEEITQWYAANHPDFVSMWQVYQTALDDAEFLGESEEIISMEDADRFKANYADYLLFNDDITDDMLYCPFLPISRDAYVYLANKNGDVIIAGEVVNLKDVKSVQETMFYQVDKEAQLLELSSTRGEINDSNHQIITREHYLYIYNKGADRKMWAETIKEGNKRWIKLSAHKKRTLLGWQKCKAKYRLTFNLQPSEYYSKTWVTTPEIIAWFNANPNGTFQTGDVSAGHRLYIGEAKEALITNPNYWPQTFRTGSVQFFIWSEAVLPYKGIFSMWDEVIIRL